jgi:hypothetical protein
MAGPPPGRAESALCLYKFRMDPSPPRPRCVVFLRLIVSDRKPKDSPAGDRRSDLRQNVSAPAPTAIATYGVTVVRDRVHGDSSPTAQASDPSSTPVTTREAIAFRIQRASI